MADNWSDDEREAWAQVADSERALSVFVEANEKLESERDALRTEIERLRSEYAELVAAAGDVVEEVDSVLCDDAHRRLWYAFTPFDLSQT